MTSWDSTPPWDRPAKPDPDAGTTAGLLELLDAQAALLVDVATGGSAIEHVNATYKRRRRALRQALGARQLPMPFPFEDLWAWRGHWKAQGMATYQSRRDHVADLARPTREILEAALAGVQVTDPGGSSAPTWSALETRLTGIVQEVNAAASRDDLQDAGRRCREVFIDAARLLADPALLPPGTEPPKAADAKGWLDLFLAGTRPGAPTASCAPSCRSPGTSRRRSPTATSTGSTPTPQRSPTCSSCGSCSSWPPVMAGDAGSQEATLTPPAR